MWGKRVHNSLMLWVRFVFSLGDLLSDRVGLCDLWLVGDGPLPPRLSDVARWVVLGAKCVFEQRWLLVSVMGWIAPLYLLREFGYLRYY